jgi:hypothetical protein
MRSWRAILAGLTAIVLSGCAGYTVGPTSGLPGGTKSLQIVPFINRSPEPRLTDPVTSALRKETQRDGTYRLETRGTGDVTLTGVITEYDRREQTLVSSDVITVKDYQLRLTAQVTARDRVTGKVLVDQSVTGYTLMRVTSDFQSAERQALPLLATDLARRVTALLTDGTW